MAQFPGEIPVLILPRLPSEYGLTGSSGLIIRYSKEWEMSKCSVKTTHETLKAS